MPEFFRQWGFGTLQDKALDIVGIGLFEPWTASSQYLEPNIGQAVNVELRRQLFLIVFFRTPCQTGSSRDPNGTNGR